MEVHLLHQRAQEEIMAKPKKPSDLDIWKGIRKRMPPPTKTKPGKRGKGVPYKRSKRSERRSG